MNMRTYIHICFPLKKQNISKITEAAENKERMPLYLSSLRYKLLQMLTVEVSS